MPALAQIGSLSMLAGSDAPGIIPLPILVSADSSSWAQVFRPAPIIVLLIVPMA
jgi:hypothetical protein